MAENFPKRVIYKITNLINEKIYVGKSSDFKQSYWGSGNGIKNAIKKYGIDNFKKEILDTAENIEDLNKKEIFWISKTNAILNGYNMSPGGDQDWQTLLSSKESFDKRNKTRWNGENGKILREKTSKRISENNPSKNKETQIKILEKKYSKDNAPWHQIIIDNFEYKSIAQASRNLSISSNIILRRIRSSKYPNYICKTIALHKKYVINQASDIQIRQKCHQIIIDNIVYDSIKSATEILKIKRPIITSRLYNSDFTNYQFLEKRKTNYGK
jgi:group I intron endonuclease